MVVYSCPRCGFVTDRTTNILNHVNRSRVCKPLVADISVKDNIENILANGVKQIRKKKVEILEAENKRLREENIENILANGGKQIRTNKVEILEAENKRLREEIERLKKENERLMKNTNQGYIYVLYNVMFDSNGGDIYKIGCSKDPKRRASEFTTSYPTPSKIEYVSKLFPDKLQAEKKLFDLLQGCRLSQKREFFNMKLEMIIKHIEIVENEILNIKY
jgi:hypothetical protein